MQAEDAVVAGLFEDATATTAAADAGEGASWQQCRPAWVFDLPWLKTRGGLGLRFAGGAGWEHRDVFFRSLVDGVVATISVPGDRLTAPPRMQRLFDEVEAWLAASSEDEVAPLWRSVLQGPRPKPKPKTKPHA
ncbi:hypothetical protein HU200_010717 [Digitaria exilis]|uniref:Uncharacterized protein n=1 Tax=Digitaria exilis TaxID=1010633 RepID=A0A835FIC5_9POAL|nr:hypothetical protein HU200_010717 [Digitaria exilis]